MRRSSQLVIRMTHRLQRFAIQMQIQIQCKYNSNKHNAVQWKSMTRKDKDGSLLLVIRSLCIVGKSTNSTNIQTQIEQICGRWRALQDCWEWNDLEPSAQAHYPTHFYSSTLLLKHTVQHTFTQAHCPAHSAKAHHCPAHFCNVIEWNVAHWSLGHISA